MACFLLCSKSQQEIPISDSVENVQKRELLGSSVSGEEDFSSDNSKVALCQNGNRVMVVVDWSVEAKEALEWTLSHAVQKNDTIVLVHVLKSLKLQRESFIGLFSFSRREDLFLLFSFFFLSFGAVRIKPPTFRDESNASNIELSSL